jgi:hypothetical protein
VTLVILLFTKTPFAFSATWRTNIYGYWALAVNLVKLSDIWGDYSGVLSEIITESTLLLTSV